MAHCSITLNKLTCARAQNSSGDDLFLRWAFHQVGTRGTFYRRPQSGYWTLKPPDVQSLSDQVVNQSIFVNQVYHFHLELWGSGTGYDLSTRFSARWRYILKGWGLAAAIPGASLVAFVGALLGLGRDDVVLESVTLPVEIEQLPDRPATGLGSFTHTLTGRLGGSTDHVEYVVVLT